MTIPKISEGTWIKIKSEINDLGIDGYVFKVYSDDRLSVGYYQNNLKAIKEDVLWEGNFWKFEINGPNGSYLKGPEEAIVKKGPYK